MNTKEAKEPIYRSDLLYRSGTTPQQAKGEQPAPAADERAAFEAWALARPLAIRSDLNRMDGGDYWLPTMERMWEAWQARASAPAPAGDAPK